MNENEMIKYYHNLEETLRKTKDVNVIEESMKILDHPEKINEYIIIGLVDAVCQNPITSESILMNIFNNSQLSIMISRNATKHENFPVAIAQDIVIDEIYPTMLKIVTVEHPHFSESFLIHVVQRLNTQNEDDRLLLSCLCGNPNFSNKVFKTLIEFDDQNETGSSSFREGFFGLENLLETTKDLEILQTAVDNKIFLYRVAINKNAPTQLLKQIVVENFDPNNEKSGWITIEIARNRNADAETLGMLKTDEHIWTRTKVALHKNTSVEVLEYLSKDSQANVRKNVAKNKNTPENILNILKDDKSKPVRENALKNIQNR